LCSFRTNIVITVVKLIKFHYPEMRGKIKNIKDYTRFYVHDIIVLTVFTLLVFSLTSFSGNHIKNEWVVVIDAGHGGKDPGTTGSKSREKDLTLDIALKTGNYVEERIEGVKVVYTRTSDKFIELYKRAEIANKEKADLFISIHLNSAPDKRIRGSETFAMGLHKDEGNLEVAMKENSVITLEEDYTTRYQGYDPNSSESFIAFSLMQNIYLEQSLNFASYIQEQFSNRVGLINRGVKQAGFLVLWQTTMPSVLVEAGFISNSEEEKFIMSEEGKEYIASAIFRAFRDYKLSIDEKSDFSAVRNSAPANNDPDKIWFMVQLVTSSTMAEPAQDNFKGLEDITELISGRYYKYATGHFNSYEEAASYRKDISAKYPDAFVIAVQRQKIIPLQEAIEKRKQN